MNGGATEAIGSSNGKSGWLIVRLEPRKGSFLTEEHKLQLQRLVAAQTNDSDEPPAAQKAHEHIRIQAELQLQKHPPPLIEPKDLRIIRDYRSWEKHGFKRSVSSDRG